MINNYSNPEAAPSSIADLIGQSPDGVSPNVGSRIEQEKISNKASQLAGEIALAGSDVDRPAPEAGHKDNNPWSLENMPGNTNDSVGPSSEKSTNSGGAFGRGVISVGTNGRGRFGMGVIKVPQNEVGPQGIKQAVQGGSVDPNHVR